MPQASAPPSTRTVDPVMYPPPALARNAIVAATSSADPARFIGTCSAKASTTSWPPYCSMPSVWIRPAATQTARIPNADHSWAMPAAKRLEGAARHRGVHHRRDRRSGAESEERDEPRVLRDHPAVRHLLGDLPGRVDVQPVHGAEALQRDVSERRRELSAGIVHEDVDALVLHSDRVEERRNLIGLADIARHRRASVAELLRDRRDRLGATAADRDAAARGDDRAGGGGADPGAATGHDGDLLSERVGRERRPEPLYHAAEYARRSHDPNERGAARRTRVRRPGRRTHARVAPRARVEPADLGPDGAEPHAPVPGRHLRRSWAWPEREACPAATASSTPRPTRSP